MIKIYKLTICGGGNGAQALAPIAAQNLNCRVDMYTPLGDEAERLRLGIAAQGGLQVTGAVGAKARPHRVSADPAEVIPGSQVVVLVLPAFAHESTLRQITPLLDEQAWVGAIPARGGFDYCAAQVLKQCGRDDVRLFGLQTLPWACRIQEYGRVVHILGVKKAVDAASRPAAEAESITMLLEQMLGLPIGTAANMLALTLANTGQLIHPGITYGLFANWDGTPFNSQEIPLFYQGLSEDGAAVLAGMSDEVQAIRTRLQPLLDLSAVRPLQEWLLHSYGEAIDDPSSLWSAFVTNRAYAGLQAPVREVAQGQFVPDLQARYLAEDVPFGLTVSQAIAQLAGVETPTMDRVIAWAGRQLGQDRPGRVPQRYGLQTLAALVAFTLERVDA